MKTQNIELTNCSLMTSKFTESTTANQRRPFERLFEGPKTVKRSKDDDVYVPEVINVQSLLDVRTILCQQRRHYNSLTLSDRIVINVCGDRYETHRSTIEFYSDTLLGNSKRRKRYYDKTRNEYFFDRNRACFEAILYYYQSQGRLRRPSYIPIDTFLEEVKFFELGKQALQQLRKDENIEEVKIIRFPKNRFRKYIWATFEYPGYYSTSKIINIISLIIILLSAISLAIESLPQYEHLGHLSCGRKSEVYSSNSTENPYNTTSNCSHIFKSPFFIIQTVCVAFFTIEFFLRLISTPSFIDFIKNIMNWVDLLAIVPYYITLIIYFAHQNNQITSSTYVALRLWYVVRFAWIFKLYRLFKPVKSLRVLVATVKESIPDFFIMITILTFLSFLFGTAVYFAENDENSQAFDSIPKATYWAIVTITSVGYGDVSPITPIGRIVACLCALFGAVTIGMFVSVLVEGYQRVYTRKLYINEDFTEFHHCSDDETNDNDSRFSSSQLRRSKTMKDTKLDEENTRTHSNDKPLSRPSSRVNFIIGYVDDDQHETFNDLIEKISSIIEEKNSNGNNIKLNIVSDEQQRLGSSSTPYGVNFNISLSSSEDTDTDDDELTEIVNGCGNKGNVLKTFQCPSSPIDNEQFNENTKTIF